jgi:CP12 domain
MKSFLHFLAISLLPILSTSFSVSSIRRRVRIGRHLAASSNDRPDASSSIQEALALSKEYGPTSPEARLAWEAVEEMDASRSSRYVFVESNILGCHGLIHD